MDITLRTEGARVYIIGNTFPLKDAIKSAGGHCDGTRKAWWVGRAKATEIERVIATTSTAPSSPTSSQGDRTPDQGASVKARATYKGKDYYVLAETRDGAKMLLAARNGAFQFWAAREATQITKTYGRENYRSGRTEYPTLGGMIRRAEELRQAKQTGACPRCEERERRGLQAPYFGSGDYDECGLCGATYREL